MAEFTQTPDLTVAQTILAQLGSHFRLVTGAKDFVGSANALTFRLPGAGGFTKFGINKVQIRLNVFDTYDIDFYRVRKHVSTHIAYKEGVYADRLRDVFTDVTGLRTSLGTLGAR